MHELNRLLQLGSVSLMVISVILGLVTVLKTKKNTVRMISLEVLANLFISVICLWALYLRQVLFFDLCLAIALVMFLSTAAYCQYLTDQERS